MKETEKTRNMSGRKVIQSRGFGYRQDKEFYLAIEKAVLEGYRVAQNYRMDDLCGRNVMGGVGQCVLYKDGVEFVDEEGSPVKDQDEPNKNLEAIIKGLKTKKDCEEFAKEHNLEIPEDKKAIPAIKKFLKEGVSL